MVDLAAPLRAHQLDVLRWVDAGCPNADTSDDGKKHTARALQARRLVTVSRRGGRWSATLTERGRYYLDNGRYPPAAAEAAVVTAHDPPATSSTQEGRGGSVNQSLVQPPVIHEATALIERLQTSGGTVVVPDPDADTRARYRRTIHAAKQHNLLPDGHDLRHTGRNTGDLVVRLYSAAQPYDTDWNRLRLNQGDIRARPPADYSALEKNPTNLQVAPESIARVLGLLHMINEAGASRKCRVGVNLATKHPKPFVKVGGARRSLDVFEEYNQVPHTLTADERRTKRLRPWAHIPEFDSVATGRLRFEVGKSPSDQRLTWRDTTTVKLEQQASRIVADIIKAVEKDERAAAARRQYEEERKAAARLAARQAAEERRRRDIERTAAWEHAIAEARRLAVEEHRRATFTTAFEQWRNAADIRAFCDALEHAATAGQTAASNGELAAWLTWARAHADNIDPTVGTPALTSLDFTIEPSPEDLRPHLNGWSPYRPAKE